MLERVRTKAEPTIDVSATPSHYELSVADVLSFLRTYWLIIAASALVALLLGVVYVMNAERTYTATAQILIETDQQPAGTLATTESLIAMDTPQIESQIALLGSEQIAGKVAALLDARRRDKAKAQVSPGLHDENSPKPSATDEKTGAPESSFFPWFSGAFFASPKTMVDPDQARLRAEIAEIQGNMDVRRVGLSYVLNVAYKAGDPQVAALVANAIGDAYVQDKLDVRAQNARRGGTWLEARIEELRRSMNNAALDVQLFKAKRDYRLIDRPSSARNGDAAADLPAFGPNSELDSATAKPSDAKGKTPDAKSDSVPPEQTTLDELESRAETYKKIYESYLQAYMETVQRQSYPGTNARVITRADPPTRKSSPRTTLALAASLVLGTIMGLGFSLVHLSFDQTARSPRQIARRLDMPLLGQVVRYSFLGDTHLEKLLPHAFRRDRNKQRNISFFIVENGMFPETARELSAAAVALKQMMDAHATRVVGLLGTTRDLNSAAVCSNLALLNARAGRRTLMIEADTATPNLQSQFASENPHGLQDLLAGSVGAAEVIVPWPSNPKLSLLMAKSTDLLWTSEQNAALRSFIDQVADQFDLVLVHLPHVASANRAAGAIDSVAIVSRAGKTMMPELLDIAADLRLGGKQPLGVIISDLT